MTGWMALVAGFVLLGSLNVVQRRALRTARQDPLTGLATRQLWTARAARAARHPQGLVLLLVDGDGLKQVNDQHGHQAGDALIAALAERLRAWTGRRGLAGRLGGDEFAAFLRLARVQHLSRELDVLQSILSIPVPHGDTMLPARASIGAVLVTELPAPRLDQAMRSADEAMYQAKHAGGGTWQLAEPRTRPHRIDLAPLRRARTHGPAPECGR